MSHASGRAGLGILFSLLSLARGQAIRAGAIDSGADFSMLWAPLSSAVVGRCWAAAGLASGLMMLSGRLRPAGWGLLMPMPVITAVSCLGTFAASSGWPPAHGYAWAGWAALQWAATAGLVWLSATGGRGGAGWKRRQHGSHGSPRS